NLCIRSRCCCRPSLVGDRSTRSSANSRHLTSDSSRVRPGAADFSSARANSLIYMLKRVGLKLHPCLTPQPCVKKCVFLPILTAHLLFVYISLSPLSQFLFDRPYSRKLEAEADQVGLQLAAKACADVRAGPVFWQQMEISDQLRGEPTVPEWLSTHPSHRNRVTQLDRLIPQYLELRESCSCPALPATDPRAVFAQSVKVLLDATRDLEGEAGKRLKPQALSQTPTSDHRRAPHTGGLATALLASSATGSPPALTLDTATHL
ncbi:unnamed protein product, partial [Oncorhynchus mykiss]